MSANFLFLQPMDKGIINNLKYLYRKEIVCMTLAYLEENVFFFFFFFFFIFFLSLSTAANISSKISILDAANFVTKIDGQ